MKTIATAWAILLASQLLAVDDAFLDKVAMIESSRNPAAVGDGGKALGEFQFHKAAWEQVSASRKAKGKTAHDYSYAHDRAIAREYAREYLGWLERSLEKRLGRKPQEWEIYAAYNRGLGGFAKLGYKFENLPPHTQRACSRLSSPPTPASTSKR